MMRKARFALIVQAILIAYYSRAAATMSLTGLISANSVTVSGDVSVSSVTISSAVISDNLEIQGRSLGVHRILQTRFSSTTATTANYSSTFTQAMDLHQSITLSGAENWLRVSLTGNFQCYLDQFDKGYLTIFRDSINLGDPSVGLLTLRSGFPTAGNYSNVSSPVGLRILDYPGDTNTHTYSVYIRKGTNIGGHAVQFPYDGTGYLLLEEVKR